MEQTSRRVVFSGRRLSLEVAGFRLDDSTVVEREIVRTRDAVVVLPILDNDKVCLISNLRHPVGKPLLELPAGICEPDEDHEATAARELAEETGFRARQLTKLCHFYTSPGILNEQLVLFAAQDLEPGSQHLDHGERIEVSIVPWAEAVTMVRDGRITDAKTIIGILFWELLRQKR